MAIEQRPRLAVVKALRVLRDVMSDTGENPSRWSFDVADGGTLVRLFYRVNARDISYVGERMTSAAMVRALRLHRSIEARGRGAEDLPS